MPWSERRYDMSAEEIKEFTDQVVARPGCVVADVHRANLIHGIWKTKFSNLENERFHKLLSDELEKPAIRNFLRKFRKKRFFFMSFSQIFHVVHKPIVVIAVALLGCGKELTDVRSPRGSLRNNLRTSDFGFWRRRS